MEKQHLHQQSLEMLKADFHYLVEAFKSMLLNLGEVKLAQSLPWVNKDPISAQTNDHDAENLLQALSICFQLLNLVEENRSTQLRRKSESQLGLTSTRGSWAETLFELKQHYSEDHIAFAALSEQAVDSFHQQACEQGGRCEGKPGSRPAYPKADVYAAFVRDPFGNKLEAIFNGFTA